MNLAIVITGYTDVTDHTEYIIKTTLGDQQFAAQHRFNNFVELHMGLTSKIAELPVLFPVAKSVFVSEALKRERVDTLQAYLRNAVRLSGEKPPSALLKFLGVPEPAERTAGQENIIAEATSAKSSRRPSSEAVEESAFSSVSNVVDERLRKRLSVQALKVVTGESSVENIVSPPVRKEMHFVDPKLVEKLALQRERHTGEQVPAELLQALEISKQGLTSLSARDVKPMTAGSYTCPEELRQLEQRHAEQLEAAAATTESWARRKQEMEAQEAAVAAMERKASVGEVDTPGGAVAGAMTGAAAEAAEVVRAARAAGAAAHEELLARAAVAEAAAAAAAAQAAQEAEKAAAHAQAEAEARAAQVESEARAAKAEADRQAWVLKARAAQAKAVADGADKGAARDAVESEIESEIESEVDSSPAKAVSPTAKMVSPPAKAVSPTAKAAPRFIEADTPTKAAEVALNLAAFSAAFVAAVCSSALDAAGAAAAKVAETVVETVAMVKAAEEADASLAVVEAAAAQSEQEAAFKAAVEAGAAAAEAAEVLHVCYSPSFEAAAARVAEEMSRAMMAEGVAASAAQAAAAAIEAEATAAAAAENAARAVWAGEALFQADAAEAASQVAKDGRGLNTRSAKLEIASAKLEMRMLRLFVLGVLLLLFLAPPMAKQLMAQGRFVMSSELQPPLWKTNVATDGSSAGEGGDTVSEGQ